MTGLATTHPPALPASGKEAPTTSQELTHRRFAKPTQVMTNRSDQHPEALNYLPAELALGPHCC